jgi:hypothetical protein
VGAIGFGLGSTGGGGGSAAFAPTDLSGLVLWLKADTLALNDGDAVGSWADSSGNGNTASQAAGASKPTYKAGIINSLPVVRFDGSNDYLTVTRNAGLEPAAITIFALIRATTPPANFSYVASKVLTAGASASYALNVSGASALRCFGNFATTGEVFAGQTIPAAVWAISPARITCMKADGSKLYLYYDGGVAGDGVTAAGNLVYDANDLKIGSYDGASLFMAFDLGELLIYNSALSDADRWSVNKYLGTRWAI